jgi:four helix bundle protein
MSRDPRKLRVFIKADGLAIRIYQATNDFPREERYGLQSQIRRAAVSVACNIVEGSARSGHRGYLHFLNTALASAYETRYLVDLCARLSFLPLDRSRELATEYDQLCRGVQMLINRIQELAERQGF